MSKKLIARLLLALAILASGLFVPSTQVSAHKPTPTPVVHPAGSVCIYDADNKIKIVFVGDPLQLRINYKNNSSFETTLEAGEDKEYDSRNIISFDLRPLDFAEGQILLDGVGCDELKNFTLKKIDLTKKSKMFTYERIGKTNLPIIRR